MAISRKDVLFVAAAAVGGLLLSTSALRPIQANRGDRQGARPAGDAAVPADSAAPADNAAVVQAVDAALGKEWESRGYRPSARASDLALFRRMHLALKGSIPSLEEIRRFETRPAATRVERAAEELLADRRMADYVAERFARAFVGVEDGPFVVFRRRRFVAWLGDAIHENRSYGAILRAMIADDGFWTDDPPVNFITVTRDEKTERPTPERLGARVARAMLGVRIDCAQCHDHPFQPWKQDDFRGLSAFFGAVHSNLGGVHDWPENDYQPLDRRTNKPVPVAPRVPFQPELLPEDGPLRARLATWLTSPANRAVDRAVVNRVWAIVFGKPLVAPIDDIASAESVPPALDILAADFTAHGRDLRRLFRTILATQAFHLESEGDDTASEGREECWAVFPMTRLRPEQVAGSLFQQASNTTLDGQSHWLVRLGRFTGVNDFVKRYGDLGEDEFDVHGGTIPQRLLLMNGKLSREQLEAGFFSASSRIANLAPDDRTAVELAYLTVLTRRPARDELEHFTARLAGTRDKLRRERLSDLFWTLANTTEFSWNH